jgi:ankyrin repeat protein
VNCTLPPPTSLWPPPPPASPPTAGRSALHAAVERSDAVLAALLASRGADPCLPSYAPAAPRRALGYGPTRSAHVGESYLRRAEAGPVGPLALAALRADPRVMRAILDGAKLEVPALIKADAGPGLGLLAAVVGGSGGAADAGLPALRALGDALPKAALRALCVTVDGAGDTPLLRAAVTTSRRLVAALVEAGASVAAERAEESGRLGEMREALAGLARALPPLRADAAKRRAEVKRFSAEAEDANRALAKGVAGGWEAARALLEEPDAEVRRKGGKTEGVKEIQKLATLARPPSQQVSTLTLVFCRIMKLKNLDASTDPAGYDPAIEAGPPSWWPAYQRAARNLRVGAKMMEVRDAPIDAAVSAKVDPHLPALEAPAHPKYAPAQAALRAWIAAATTDYRTTRAPGYDPAMISYISARDELAEAEASIGALRAEIADSPTSANALNLCLRDPAPPAGARGYGGSGPGAVAARTQEVALELIDRGVDVLKPDVTGETPITVACRKRYWRVALAIIERGCEVSGACWGKRGMVRFGDSPDRDSTPLDFVCSGTRADLAEDDRSCRLMVLRELLVRGAQITPACMSNAVRSKDEVVVSILMASEVSGVACDGPTLSQPYRLPPHTPPLQNAALAVLDQDGLKWDVSTEPEITITSGGKPKKIKKTVPRRPPINTTFSSRVTNSATSSTLLPHSNANQPLSFGFIRIPPSSFPKHLSMLSYDSFDSNVRVCLNLLHAASGEGAGGELYRQSEISVTHSHFHFPGGPSAIFTVLNNTVAVLPSTVSHPLSSLLIDVPSGDVLLSDSSSAPFAAIFTGALKSRQYTNFLRILVSPDVPHTDSAVALVHRLAKAGDVELLSCVMNGSQYVNRAAMDVTHDMLTRSDVSGKTALYVRAKRVQRAEQQDVESLPP